MKDVTGTARPVRDFRNLLSFLKRKFTFKKLSQPRRLYFVLILLMAVYYYIYLPALNILVPEFWIFLGLIVLGILIIEINHDGRAFFSGQNQSLKGLSLKYKLLIYPWPIFLVIFLLSLLVTSPLFIADKYAQMLKVEEAEFVTDFPETNLNQVPLIDRDTATRLGNRKLGSLTKLVSQFEVAPDYTQVNIQSQPYRVTPLEYAGFFKWLNNFQKGIPHYLQVDTVTGDVELKTPPAPIKYSYSDKFNRNIFRHLRFNYPFTIFSRPSFEVDDEGIPYYVATVYKRNFIFREPEADGVVLVNAMTGESQKYQLDETPAWIDRVHSSDIILHQLTMHGQYQGGFWNSLFAKNGVTEPTEGYNYIPLGDDIYLYTGLTSVAADESNIGFILVNLRTKQTKFYPLEAAEEFSAMQSAEGSVQETEYQATFPLLVNLKGRAMYVLTLKDNSGLIRKYALVDAQNYQRVFVENTLDKLLTAYQADGGLDIQDLDQEEELVDLQGQVEAIQAVVVDGDSVYYFMVDGQIYRANVKLNQGLPFLEPGQTVDFKANSEGLVRELEIQE